LALNFFKLIKDFLFFCREQAEKYLNKEKENALKNKNDQNVQIIANNGPTSNYEEIRRKIFSDVKEASNFINSELSKIDDGKSKFSAKDVKVDFKHRIE
jgi:hypothetical protein